MSAFIEIQQRDRELYQAYKKALLQPHVRTVAQAIQAAIHTPTSRYWVSTSYVYRDIRARLRGRTAKGDPSARRKGGPRPCKEKMYQALYEIYGELVRKRYFEGCSTYFLASFIVNRPAPRFYIEFRRARDIITRMRREAREKKG